MTQIIAYLTFNGNCREAMTFYQNCLGGELYLQTFGESPMADKLPPEMKDCIIHSTLSKTGWSLMATDMVGEQGLIRGNSVSMLLQCGSEAEIRACYAQISDGGQATHPLEDTFRGALFGGLTDRFGNHWLLNFDKQNFELKNNKS